MEFAILYHMLTTFIPVIPITVIYSFAWKYYRRRANWERQEIPTQKDERKSHIIAVFTFALCSFDFLIGLTITGVPGWYCALMSVLGLLGASIATIATIRW